MNIVTTQPVRVLHVIRVMDRGGAESMVMNLYRAIDRTRVQFDFMVHLQRPGLFDAEIEELGGRIFRVPEYIGINSLPYALAWKRYLAEEERHPIIHGHITSCAAIYLGMAKRRGAVTIAHAHASDDGGGPAGAFLKMMYKPLPRVVDHMFAASQAAAVHVFGKGVAKDPRYHFLSNGIDVSAYDDLESLRRSAREEFGLQDADVVGHVGRFVDIKNHAFLVRLFSEVAQINPRARLLLVGDGPLRQNLEKLASQRGIADKVVFASVRPDVPRMLAAMDVFCFPSKNEGLGIALIEAQTSGLPCVISDSLPNEVDVTDLIHRKSLNSPEKEWAGDICDLLSATSSSTRSEQYRQQVAAAGFDVSTTADWLCDFYLNHASTPQ